MGDNRRFALQSLAASLLVLTSFQSVLAGAKKLPPPEIIEAGTAIAVRLSDDVRATVSDGKVFSGVMDRQSRDAEGHVTIPRDAFVELLIRRTSNHEYTLDLESVIVQGRRMAVQTESNAPDSGAQGIANEKPGADQPAGSDSALVGAIVGAFTWGGGGAEIRQASTGIVRRDLRLSTRGEAVKLPAGTVVVFRLKKSLHAGVPDVGFSRNGQHFHRGFGSVAGNSDAYEAGLRAGREDKRRGAAEQQKTVWSHSLVTDYEAGYARGFAETPVQVNAPNTIQIGADHFIRWNGPAASQVFVKIDGDKTLFSVADSGVQPAPWIRYGHKYVFTLVDEKGKEIARDEHDLRPNRK
ncbi:MAG TPA: hypothetical protein VFY29_10220 [Terriglobia bacterium]|nr:hypothetical protein [Terriglobia bacterium]